MADTVGQTDLLGLDIDKVAKGYAEREYIFKRYCTILPMKGDSVRYYTKTAGDLSATAPSYLKTDALSEPEVLEVSWTRSTAYSVPYKVQGIISREDIKSADVDVLKTTVRDLTRAIIKAVDTAIWDVLSESRSPSNIQTFATTAQGGDQWDAASYAADPIKDIEHAKKMIADYDYDTSNCVLFVDPTGAKALNAWLISGKGSSIPQFASDKVKTGEVTRIMGVTIVKSNNVTTDNALMCVPKTSCTYRQRFPLQAVQITDPLLSTTVRVAEDGIAYLTDPKSVVLITDINT